MAGLISAKLNSDGYKTSTHYSQVFAKLHSKMQESLSSNSNIFRMIDSDALYTYGVDEAVINFIFPELRSGSYRHKDVKNPSGLERKTFALELMNGYASTCHKCNKKEFESLLDGTLGKPNKKSDSVSGSSVSSVSKSSTEKKAKPICCLNDIYMRDTGFYNLQYNITNFFHMESILASLRALPFYKLKMNSWYMPALTFGNVLEGIMFINKYTFALRNKSNIPGRVKRTEKTQESAFSNSKEDKSIEHDKKKEPNEKKQSNKPKITRKIDKHLVLCNVRSANLDNEIEKYLEGVRLAYAVENFYPILIYPNKLNILSYYPEDKKTQKTISIHKMLELVKHRHGFIL
jgi:hypothetical protein